MIKTLAVALSFLTIVPLPVKDVSPRTLTASASFFPLVGWVIGLVMAGCGFMFLRAGIHFIAAAVLVVAVQAWFTRGLHLDGVADFCDGCAGSFEREKRLAIMKDSATGAFGVVGLVLVLLLKISGISFVFQVLEGGGNHHAYYSLLFLAFVPAASRWSMSTLAWKSKYPREMGTGHVFVGKVNLLSLGVGFIFLLPAFALSIMSQTWILALAGALALSFLPSLVLRFLSRQKFGGVTGDVLGASCEFGEALGWLALSMFVVI